jgi:hypothetical protein
MRVCRVGRAADAPKLPGGPAPAAGRCGGRCGMLRLAALLRAVAGLLHRPGGVRLSPRSNGASIAPPAHGRGTLPARRRVQCP